MEDLDYEELDPGIRRTVRWLNSKGYRTCDSGDGRTKPAAGWSLDEARDYAHVSIEIKGYYCVRVADQLLQDLAVIGIKVQPQGPEGNRDVSIQASYDPATRVSVVDVMGLDDSMLPPGKGDHMTRDDRKPLPPDVLIDALQDRIHPTNGRLLNATPVTTVGELAAVVRYLRAMAEASRQAALYLGDQDGTSALDRAWAWEAAADAFERGAHLDPDRL